jgi:glycerol-3-phosphate acyltransferase PlsX
MGSALIKAVDHKDKPTVAALNVGVEEIKGNDQVKQTAQMLSDCDVMNYVGYVEGNDFYSGEVDLIVCDGFVGNVALKSSEGLYKLIYTVLQESFRKNIWTKLIGVLSRPILMQLKKRMDPARYNGATLIGLNGIVVKSHGGASETAFQFALEQAALQVENQVVDLVRKQISSFVAQGVSL